MGTGRHKVAMCPCPPCPLFSVDSKQYEDKITEELRDMDSQRWSETKSGVMPPKKAGMMWFHLLHETGFHFFPSSYLTVHTDWCGWAE